MIATPPKRSAAHIMIGHPASPLVEAGVVHGDDVGMIKPGRGAGLAKEAFHHPLAGIGQPKHLERHVAVEPWVVGQKDLAETTVAQTLAKLKPAQAAQRPPTPGRHPVRRRGRRRRRGRSAADSVDRIVGTAAVERRAATRRPAVERLPAMGTITAELNVVAVAGDDLDASQTSPADDSDRRTHVLNSYQSLNRKARPTVRSLASSVLAA